MIQDLLNKYNLTENEPMSKHTTFRIGGKADLFVSADEKSLPQILKEAADEKIPVTIIGNGSNLLVGDGGIRGLVIEIGKGLVFNKYTGSRGKAGSNDANAEYIAKLRNIMDTNDISFQTAELGKVDQGGGGTIAYILANYDMNVIDCGVPVLNMHSPWEIISKVDLFETFRGYVAFIKEA